MDKRTNSNTTFSPADRIPAHNSTYPKGGLLYSKEHVGKLHRKLQSINISFAALRVAAERCTPLLQTDKNLKNVMILILTVVCLTDLKGQQILAEQPFNGNTSYGKHATAIESVTELPDQIQSSLEAYLTDMLGSSIKNVTFSHGQKVDLNSYFSEPNRKASNYQWLVPSYDLNYVLSDTTLGIKSYYIQLRLDEYGQLLSTNWPRKGYSNKENFPSTNKIVRFALSQAKSRGFLTSEYLSDLKYQSNSESLNWVFKFPKTLKADNTEYDVIEINLTSLKVVGEYTIKTSTVN